MCGRYASFRSAQDLADAFSVEQISDAAAAVTPGYNIAPTDAVRVVLERREHTRTGRVDRADRADPADHRDEAAADAPTESASQQQPVVRAMHAARWGLIPPWAKDPRIGARMINARSESVDQKRAFAPSLAKRRCLVVADGYYEWHTAPDPAGGTKPIKTPYFIHPTASGPIAFAGLYSWWADPERDADDPDRWVLSTTIITQAARDGLEQIHDREPAVLDPQQLAAWMDPQTGVDQALQILGSPTPPLSWHEVGRAVGSVRNQGAHLIEPA